jgi:hypothetical protein
MHSADESMTEAGVVERFRVIDPARAPEHAKIWEIVPEDDGGGTGDA